MLILGTSCLLQNTMTYVCFFLPVCQGINRAALQETAVGSSERLHREKLLERDRRELSPFRYTLV